MEHQPLLEKDGFVTVALWPQAAAVPERHRRVLHVNAVLCSLLLLATLHFGLWPLWSFGSVFLLLLLLPRAVSFSFSALTRTASQTSTARISRPRRAYPPEWSLWAQPSQVPHLQRLQRPRRRWRRLPAVAVDVSAGIWRWTQPDGAAGCAASRPRLSA